MYESSAMTETAIAPKIKSYRIELTLSVLETKITKFANSVDLDEVAHLEPPHLDLRCLPSRL